MFLNLLGATIFSTILAVVFGQDYITIPLSLKKCPVKGDKGLNYELTLNEADDGSKSFSLSFDLTQVFDKECTYTANMKMKNGGIYVEYMQTNGNLCQVFHNMLKPAWERFRQALKPPLKESCFMEPGSYSIKGFQIYKDEVNVATPSAGEYRVDVHYFCNNVELMCVLAEYLIVEDDEDDE